VGVYRIDDDTERAVILQDGELHTRRTGGGPQPVLPASETRFYYPNSLSWFDLVLEDGKVTAMEMHQGGRNAAETAVKIADTVEVPAVIDLDPAVFDAYVGEYELAPEFIITVYREEDRFWAQATGQRAFELLPESETAFALRDVDARVEFQRDDTGAVTGLVLFQGGQEMPATRR
jgi:hypothetical protein